MSDEHNARQATRLVHDPAPLSICEAAGVECGLHYLECDDQPDLCRYHQGVQDALEVLREGLCVLLGVVDGEPPQ